MIIAIQTFIYFRQTLLTFLARFLRPCYFNILLNHKSIKADEDESDDEDIEEQVYADTDEEKGVVFFPPVYVQRYAAVTDCLMENGWRGEIEKVVELGYHDKSFIKYLKEIPGIKTILGVDIEDATLLSLDQFDDNLTENEDLSHITMFQGNAADPDYRLIGCDAVVAIEMIEHMLPHDLERLVHTVFGFTKPHIAIFTTPNANFNELFKSLEKNGLRRMDHFFEWTREQFNEWCANIVTRYPDYKVSCRGIGPGPVGTRHLGCCSQMALFESINYHKQQDLAPNSLTLLADAPEQSLTQLVGESDSADVVASEKSISMQSFQPMSITNILYKPCSALTLPLFYEESYCLETISYCDQTSQCNIELEIARNYLMFDDFDEMSSTIMVARAPLYDKIYDIEDLISRLNCSTYTVTKFSKFARNLMEKYKKIRPPASTRKIVTEIKHFSEMMDVKKQCTDEPIWSNFNWGENAPYWNNYYKIVCDNYYPYSMESQENLILDQVIQEVNRCIDGQSPDISAERDRLYIPLNRLMKVVSHLTKDVEKVKELLQWNGYVIENDAVVYTYSLDSDKDDGLWTNERPSVDNLKSQESNGLGLHRCINQKLQKLRHISCNNSDLDTELDKVLQRLTKLAIRSKCSETALSPQWMQRKLYELLSLTERAIETRRLHFIQNYTLSEYKVSNEEKSQNMMELDKYKEADSKTFEIEVKYKHLVEDCFVLNNFTVEKAELPNIDVNQVRNEDKYLESATKEAKPILTNQIDILNIDKSKNHTNINNLRTMKFYQNCLMKYARHRNTKMNRNKSMKTSKKNPRRLIVKDSPKKTFLCTISTSKTGRFGQKQKDKNSWGRRYSSALSCKPIPESLIKLCHPELCSEKYVKNIWLVDTEDGTEQPNNNETILETEESQLISIVMDDADETTSLQYTSVIDENTTIDENDYKAVPGANKLTSMCFYKKNTSGDNQNPEDMFVNDVNEPSTSKGFRHVNMDVQCGPDVVIPSDSKDDISEHIKIVENSNKEFGTSMNDDTKNTANAKVSWNKMHAGIYIKDSDTNTNTENGIEKKYPPSNDDENVIINYSTDAHSVMNESKIEAEFDNFVEAKPKNNSGQHISDGAMINSCKDSDTSHDIIFQGTWKNRSVNPVKKTLDDFHKENIPQNQINTVLHMTPITDQVSIYSSVNQKTSSKQSTAKRSLSSSKSTKTDKICNKVKINRAVKEKDELSQHVDILNEVSKNALVHCNPDHIDQIINTSLKAISQITSNQNQNKSISNYILPKLPEPVNIIIFKEEETVSPKKLSNVEIPLKQSTVIIENRTSDCKKIGFEQLDLLDTTDNNINARLAVVTKSVKKRFLIKNCEQNLNCTNSNDQISQKNSEKSNIIKQKIIKPTVRVDRKKSREITRVKPLKHKDVKMNIHNVLVNNDSKIDIKATTSADIANEVKEEKLKKGKLVSKIFEKSKIRLMQARPNSAFPNSKTSLKKTVKSENIRESHAPEKKLKTKKNICPQKNILKRSNSQIDRFAIKQQSQNSLSKELKEIVQEKQTLERSNTDSSINVKHSNSKKMMRVTLEGKHEKVKVKIPTLKLPNTEVKNKQNKFISDLAKIQNIMRDEHEKLKLLKTALSQPNTERISEAKSSEGELQIINESLAENTVNTSNDSNETVIKTSKPRDTVKRYCTESDNSLKTKSMMLEQKYAQSNCKENNEYLLENDLVNSELSVIQDVQDKHEKSEQKITSLLTSNADLETSDPILTDVVLCNISDIQKDTIEKFEPKVLFTIRSDLERTLTNKHAKSQVEISKSKNMKNRKHSLIRSSLMTQSEKPTFSVTQKRLKRYKGECLRGFVTKNLKSKVRLSRSKVEELQKDLLVLKLFDNERNYMVFCNEIKNKSSDIDCITPKSSKLENKNEDGKIKKIQCSSSTCSTSNSVITVKSFGSIGTRPLSDSSVTPSHCKLISGNTTNSTVTKHKSRKSKFAKHVADKLKMTESSKKTISNKKDNEKLKFFKGKSRNILMSQCFNSDSSALQSPSHNKCIIKVPSPSIKKRKSLESNDTGIQKIKSSPDILSENVKISNIVGTKRPLDPYISDSRTDISSPKREKNKASTSNLDLNNIELKKSTDIDKNYQFASLPEDDPVHSSFDKSFSECMSHSNIASVDNFVVEVFTALENLIADDVKPADNVILGNSNLELKKENEAYDDNTFKKDEESICESVKLTEPKIEDEISTPTETDCLSYRSITSVSTYSDAYLADNELTSLGTVKANVSSVTELFERSDQFTVQTANGSVPFQAFSGYSMNRAPVEGDIPDYCNLIDSETGSVAATRPRQATSEEVLGGGISSESFASCMIEDDSVVPDWLFAIMTQHHEMDESSDATRPSEGLPEERLVDVNGNLESVVGLESGAGDGRGMHSQQDSSGQGMSIDSSGSSSPPQSETILIDPSNFTAQFGTLLESVESSDGSVENLEFEDTDSLAIQGHHLSPGAHSLSADADVSSTGTDGSTPPPPAHLPPAHP